MSAPVFNPRAALESLRAERAALTASVASGQGGESGLVTDSTSRTPLLDTRLNRLRRMRYNVIASANMLNVDATRGGFRVRPVFITLTYRNAEQPEPKHITAFVDRCKKHLKRRGQHFRYVWVAELQERGVLHYHVIVWLPHGWLLPKPDKSGWWPHGWSNIKRAEAPVGYLAHYAGKFKTKAHASGFHIPKGFRLYAVGGLDVEDRLRRAWANLPGWIRDHMTPEDRAKRIRGGGFISRLTHEFYPSIYKLGRIVKAGGGAFVTLIPALPEGVELCSPYTFPKS